MVKVEGNQLRVGNVIEYQDRLWRVVKTQHVKPGKGGAYLQAELKDVRSGIKTNTRFRSSESVERAFIDRRKHTYLYGSSSEHTFMDSQTFEQRTLSEVAIDPDIAVYFSDGLEVEIDLYEGEAIGIHLPETMILQVEETEASIKGQTATGSYKPAVLSNKLRVMVPPYVDVGTKVIIRTADNTFSGRA